MLIIRIFHYIIELYYTLLSLLYYPFYYPLYATGHSKFLVAFSPLNPGPFPLFPFLSIPPLSSFTVSFNATHIPLFPSILYFSRAFSSLSLHLIPSIHYHHHLLFHLSPVLLPLFTSFPFSLSHSILIMYSMYYLCINVLFRS